MEVNMENNQKLLQICSEVMDVALDSITLDTTRDELDEFDSLAIVQILAEMEDSFGIRIAEGILDEVKIVCIGDFLKLL